LLSESIYMIEVGWQSMLCGFPSPQHGTSSGWGLRRQPPDMEGSWEHMEKAIANSR